MSSESDSATPDIIELKRLQEKDDKFIISLVTAVEKNPILYDHKNPQYRNTEKKVETWSTIKDSLKYIGDTQELADYWKIVRDRYTKARRKFILKKPTKFKFLNECRFLNPHITDRSSWYEKPTDFSEPNKTTKQPTDSHFYNMLIQKVKDNPCFYDNNDYYYRRFQYKVAKWQSIANELGFEGDHQDMYKQWKKMRDRYVRELKKLKVSGKSKDFCKWEFFGAMDWMESFVEEQKPLEEYELIVDKNNIDDRIIRPVKKQRPKKSMIPPKLSKIAKVELVDHTVNMKSDSRRNIFDYGVSSSEESSEFDEPAKKRRTQESTTSTQYVYYLATAGSQIQLINSNGGITTTQGQFMSAPIGQVFNVVQPSSIPQYVVSETHMSTQHPGEKTIKEENPFEYQELENLTSLQPLSNYNFDKNGLYESNNNYYEEVADVVSTESLADDINQPSYNCISTADIPDNFLAEEEENVIINMDDLNEQSGNDLHRFNLYQTDSDIYESMPESFLAF